MFLNHREVYFEEQVFRPAVKENILRKQVSHPSGTECTHRGPIEAEKIASQGVLHYALGIHSPPRLKQLDLGSISSTLV